MTDFDKEIQRYVIEALTAKNAVMEEWVERSITDPEGRGILMVQDGPFRTLFRLDAAVPYGNLFEFPSLEAVENWIRRGCPTG